MSNGFLQRGGLWVLGQFTLMLAVAILGMTCRTETRILAMFVGGLFFLGASGLCGIAGMAALGRKLTPFPKPAAQAELVQNGIYSLIRHPLYTAVFCAATGWSLIRGSWSALAASLVMAVFFDAKARREEHWLRQQFPDYDRYAQQVRRFIPWVY
ncbi:MAG TPA: isoprenylcysteine carboxylmethyltransferase family protein [Verrucomicrobiae bacterium]|nr:isoprenylcysteine carboxylmethyltransferase family protein [Verrucomicrobiae bacterium]